jgi:hypothetical protein
VAIWERGNYQTGFNATYVDRNDVSYVWGAYPLAVLAVTVTAGVVTRGRAGDGVWQP